ncbi:MULTISPECIES: hypothetical protein [Sinorhizobium]|uniref:hypothetical protein n=1 Tax=Sinorhizobium TaxID=28105 RepID=UPI0013E3F59D
MPRSRRDSRSVDCVLLAREPGEHGGHVLGDLAVDGEQVGDVEAAERLGVPPGEQEVRHPAAVAGIVVGDVQQLLEGESDAVFHVLSFQQP